MKSLMSNARTDPGRNARTAPNSRKRFAFIRAAMIFMFFVIIASVVAFLRSNLAYFLMFTSIGAIAGLTEFLIAKKTSQAQLFRRTSLMFLSSGLFIMALIIGINFQFSQIFIDLYAGIVTGALIQFVAARLILPFLFGNLFCSRACWDGAAFEIGEKLLPQKKNEFAPAKTSRSKSAWVYLIIIITISSLFGLYYALKPGSNAIRTVFVVQNIIIISIGLVLSSFTTRRAYCRNLCPFLTVSGIIAPFSLFKVSPINHKKCISCGKCTRECPMGINVEEYIKNNKRVDHPDCIMCESCITACELECIIVKMK